MNDALSIIRDFSIDTYVQLMGSNVVREVDLLTRVPDAFISLKVARFDTTRNVVNVSYDGNQIAGDFLLNVVQAAQKVSPVRMYRTPLITREILFYMTQPGLYTSNGFMEDGGTMPAIRLLRFHINRFAITNKKVLGIQMNEFSWWLDFRDVVIQDKPS
jgi:hypothetical protein